MKKTKWIIAGAFAVCISGFLALPDNFYLRRALIHGLPGINDHTFFENRIIHANQPEAWDIAPDYNKRSIDPVYRPVFDKLETVAYLVVQDTALLFEKYWEGYSPESRSNSFSMAKSILSLTVGCAIDDGAIQSVHQRVSDFFPQFEGYDDVPLTIQHLLTMSAGMDFDEAYASPFSKTTQLYYGNDLKKITLGMKEVTRPGVKFNYQSGVTQLLALIVEKATGETISAYVSRKIWTPIGAEEDALWSLDRKDGTEKAYCCFNTNARDFARLGQLILNGGKWKDRQLISAAYLQEATNPARWLQSDHSEQPNENYGYQFWHIRHKGMDIPYLRGINGQYIFAIPDKNAVVVRLGHKRSKTRTPQNEPDDILTWLDAALSILK